jgi:hypothetical protein
MSAQWWLDHDWLIQLAAFLPLAAILIVCWWWGRPDALKALGTMSARWLQSRDRFRKS